MLEDPGRLEQEYRRRLAPPASDAHGSVDAQLGKLRQGLARLIDSYAEGLIEKAEFEPRITRLRQRIAGLEEEAQQLAQAVSLQQELRLILGRLETFAAQVRDGLVGADWMTRRELIRALVKRVEIAEDEVTVVFRVGPDPFVDSPDRGVLQDCGGRDQPHPRKYLPGQTGQVCRNGAHSSLHPRHGTSTKSEVPHTQCTHGVLAEEREPGTSESAAEAETTPPIQ